MSTGNLKQDTGVLVSDFDGTMTRHDFYKLAIESLLPKDTPDYWAEYRDGNCTHFQALQRYFASIHANEKEVLAVLARMELDPGLAESVNSLRRAGWRVVVASAGCEWYIRRLLDEAGVAEVSVHANPGVFKNGKGLLMEMPTDSPYLSHTLGVDKSKVVRTYLDEGKTVAFAGDGFPDVDSARLVSSDLRFGRADLADVLEREGLEYRPFETWSEIAQKLLERSA
jgi:2-hydroxy-3-keto-5-methylthiopentenyl-1-phosphate phosphatase